MKIMGAQRQRTHCSGRGKGGGIHIHTHIQAFAGGHFFFAKIFAKMFFGYENFREHFFAKNLTKTRGTLKGRLSKCVGKVPK